MQDQLNRIYRLQNELDRRDKYLNDRYDRVADARDSVLQKRGLTAVQSYSDKSNDVLMTRAQIWKYDSLRGEARRNYADRLEQGLSVG